METRFAVPPADASSPQDPQAQFAQVPADQAAFAVDPTGSQAAGADQFANDPQSFASQPQEPGFNQEYLPQSEPEYLVVEWLADSRVVHKHSRQYYSSLLVVVLLVSLILFFANQIALIFVVLGFLFVTYILNSVKPETLSHMITTYGIRYNGQLYFWEQMTRFWIRDNRGKMEVHVEIPDMMAKQMIVLPSNAQSPVAVTVEDLVDIIGRFVPYQQPLPNQIDKWVQWLEEKFPLETSVEEPVPEAQGPISNSEIPE